MLTPRQLPQFSTTLELTIVSYFIFEMASRLLYLSLMTQKINYFFLICLFSLIACNPENKKEKSSEIPTWSSDVASILYKNCTPCHRPGESGAFVILKYADAVKKAKLIKFMTKTKAMPPWPADPNYSHFIGERVLTEEEISLISNWVDNGTPRGDSLNEPKAPIFYTGSYFGKPDLIIKLQKPVLIKGNGTDVFLIAKYSYHIEKDTLVDFVEFVPDQRKLVHHVNGHLVSYDENRKFNYMTGEFIHSDTRTQLMEVYKQMHIPYTDNQEPHFPTLTMNTVYYLPGFIPPVYPKEVGGYRLKRTDCFC